MPSLLTIRGVVRSLRLGWVLRQVGLAQTKALPPTSMVLAAEALECQRICES